jgi:hypothetical protein
VSRHDRDTTSGGDAVTSENAMRGGDKRGGNVTRTEQRLQEAFAAAAETVRPESLEPLTERPEQAERPERTEREVARRRAVARWAAPLAAVAGVVVLVGVVLVVRDESPSAPALGTGSLSAPPRFFLSLVKGQSAELRNADTGKVIGHVAQPGGVSWQGPVAAAPGDTDFYLAGKASGRFGIWRVSMADDRTHTPLRVPAVSSKAAIASLSVSPDGRRIAYSTFPLKPAAVKGGMPGPPTADTSAYVHILTLTTGRDRRLSLSDLVFDVPPLLRWTKDGRSLGLMVGSGQGDRLTSSGGLFVARLMRVSGGALFGPGYESRGVGMFGPDGRLYVASPSDPDGNGKAPSLAEFSATSDSSWTTLAAWPKESDAAVDLWSPPLISGDGRQILYTREGHLHRFELPTRTDHDLGALASGQVTWYAW